MKDFIESMEDAATDRFLEMTENVPTGYFKCYCGKIALIEDAQPMSNNPYAMPGCLDCFEEWRGKVEDRCK